MRIPTSSGMSSRETAELINRVGSYIDEVYVDEGVLVYGDALGRMGQPCDFDAATTPSAAFPAEDKVAESFMPVCASMPAARDLEGRLENLDESFAQTVLRLIDERGMRDIDVYKRANMSRQLFAKIRKDANYRPTKKTACALAFALGLDHDDALALLSRAGFTLSHSSKFDVIVEYFLVNKIHDIHQVNLALYAYDQQILG